MRKRVAYYMMICSAELILMTACILSFILPPTPGMILPKPEIIIPLVNSFTVILGAILYFKEIAILEYLILGIQSFFTTISGYETIGNFLFLALNILMFINNYYKTAHKRKLTLICIFWFITQLTLIPFGIHRFILNAAACVFFFCFSTYIYKRLESQLKIFTPTKKITSNIDLPEPNEQLILKNYGLTKRQRDFIEAIIISKKTYGELAIRYNISVSTVKKDMQQVFDKFNVKNLANLTLLLLQFDLVYN